MPAIPESREVSEMHVSRLTSAWAKAHTPGGPTPAYFFIGDYDDEAFLAFRNDLLHTVTNTVDHGRTIALILVERILKGLKKLTGQASDNWIPIDQNDVQTWEQVAHTMLSDVRQGDYVGASEAFDYLVAESTAYVEVAQLVGKFITANYFLRNPENSPKSA